MTRLKTLDNPRSTPAKANAIPIAELFSSIQGEGKLTGTPSFFIRVSGCNLRCVWCDTPYASWNPEGESMPLHEIVERASTAALRHVVMTGGEPMIFPQIVDLTRALRKNGHHITIETAGAVDQDVACDLMSLSPKLSNSIPLDDPRWAKRHDDRRLSVVVLQSLIDRFSNRQLKFVVTGETGSHDLAEIDAILAQLTGWSSDDVILMPEGVEVPSRRRASRIADLCMERGWRYGHRLHIELFGNTRGT